VLCARRAQAPAAEARFVRRSPQKESSLPLVSRNRLHIAHWPAWAPASRAASAYVLLRTQQLQLRRLRLRVSRGSFRWVAFLMGIAGAMPAAGCAHYLREVARQDWLMRGGRNLMVFGGPGHTTYLGCLNCSNGSGDSVFFEGGTYNGAYVAPSILNRSSVFVSPHSAYSACNPFATDPPVIVDERGTSYGRLTVNQQRTDRPSIEELREWIINACAGHGAGP
jgi:hypothetical protein